MPDDARGITVVGLGPGEAAHLTLAAQAALASAGTVWVRTTRHPSLAAIPPGVRVHSFDALYEAHDAFADVYDAIADALVALAS